MSGHRREADADLRLALDRARPSEPELIGAGLALDVVLKRRRCRAVDALARGEIDDSPPGSRARKLRFVDPVVEGLPEIENAEKNHEQDRDDERELDNCCT